jgi:hypothetical protein
MRPHQHGMWNVPPSEGAFLRDLSRIDSITSLSAEFIAAIRIASLTIHANILRAVRKSFSILLIREFFSRREDFEAVILSAAENLLFSGGSETQQVLRFAEHDIPFGCGRWAAL